MNKPKKNIVWLASYPKSGNTWVRIILENLFYKEKSLDLNKLQISKHASSRILFDDYTGVSSSDLTPSEIRKLMPKVYSRLAKETDELQFIKVHDAWKREDESASVFPSNITKAVIYIIRNPLDLAVSYSKHSNKDLDKMIEEMNKTTNTLCRKNDRIYNQFSQRLHNWSEHVVSWVDESGLPVIVIRYEDLLDNSYSAVDQLLQFLEIEKTESEIHEAIKLSDFSVLSKLESENGFNEKPLKMEKFFRTGKAGDWKNHLNADQVEQIKHKHFSIMKRYQYI